MWLLIMSVGMKRPWGLLFTIADRLFLDVLWEKQRERITALSFKVSSSHCCNDVHEVDELFFSSYSFSNPTSINVEKYTYVDIVVEHE